jgi:hypothetical protein
MSNKPVTAKDIVIEHGGSFDGVTCKAHFFLPHEMVMDEMRFHAMTRDLLTVDSSFKFVRHEGTWDLFRFTGERKPFKTVWVHCRDVPHNVYPTIRLQIHPDGVIEMFEKGRKLGFTTTVAAIYTRAMMNDILQKAAAKARNKRKKRKC